MPDNRRYPPRPGPGQARRGPAGPDSPEARRRRAEARRRRKRQILRNRIIFAVGCLAVLALLIFGIVKAVGLIKGALGGQDASAGSAASGASSSSAQSAAGGDTTGAAAGSAPAESALPPADPDDWRMILVNNNIPLPDGYTVETRVAETANSKELQTEAADAYQQMKAAAAAEGVELLLCSGYRSVEYQTGLFNDELDRWKADGLSEQEAYDKAKTVVAVPGYSEHNTGLAADIVTPDHQTLDEAFEETDAFLWLSQHAQEYGFILRYPIDKQAITGIIYEPWHYRYVGPENAAAIKQSGKCLEEYLTDPSGGAA